MRTPIKKTAKKIAVAGLLLSALPALAKPAHHAVLRHGSTKMHKSVKTTHLRETGGITSERATEIQTALIRQGYMSGEPSGAWDAQTSAAMARLQSDNGWQSKITPDSRGLIKLGLGPQNPTAATSR